MKISKIFSLVLFALMSHAGPFDASVSVGGVEVSVNCNPQLNFYDIDDSFCSAVNGFSLNVGSFGIGGCSIELGSTSECFFDDLRSRCSSLVSSNVSTPLRSALASSLEFDLLKGDGFRSTKTCGNKKQYGETRHPSGLTQNEIYEKTSISHMSKDYSIFSQEIDGIRDCMKVDGEKCLEPGHRKLPKDTLEAEKEIMKSAHAIAAADDSVAANMGSVEIELKKKLEDCKEKEGSARETCRDEVLNSEESPQSMATKEIAKLELAAAIELKMMKQATRGDTYYVYKDAESMRKLPADVVGEYANGVERQNAADALVESLYKEILDLKKQAVRATYSSSTDGAEPYDAKANIQGLRTVLGVGEM